jgi:hypothetical protein
VVCFAITCEGQGQTVIEYAKTRKVASLSGTVTDTMGTVIPNVNVCSMANDWKKELGCTATGSDGRWSLPSAANENTYHLRFMKDGFNQVLMRVRLVKRSVTRFIVELPVAELNYGVRLLGKAVSACAYRH